MSKLLTTIYFLIASTLLRTLDKGKTGEYAGQSKNKKKWKTKQCCTLTATEICREVKRNHIAILLSWWAVIGWMHSTFVNFVFSVLLLVEEVGCLQESATMLNVNLLIHSFIEENPIHREWASHLLAIKETTIRKATCYISKRAWRLRKLLLVIFVLGSALRCSLHCIEDLKYFKYCLFLSWPMEHIEEKCCFYAARARENTSYNYSSLTTVNKINKMLMILWILEAREKNLRACFYATHKESK